MLCTRQAAGPSAYWPLRASLSTWMAASKMPPRASACSSYPSILGLAACRNGGLDDGTAETHLALIEDDGLARCHRSLRLIEANQPAAFDRFQCAVLVRLAIADLGCEAQGLLYVHGVDPIDERALECAG